MTEYRIAFAASAAREYRSLPAVVRRRVTQAVGGLRYLPRPPGVRKLQGHERLYRIRVGDYRVVYLIDDATRSIRVTRVRHRREAYE